MPKLRLLFINMPYRHKLIVIKAWWLFVYWHLLISRVAYKKWRKKLLKSNKTDSNSSITEVISIIKLTESVARHHIVPINCLRRCAVQKQLLAQLGHATQLVFGVKKSAGQYQAHCWLTFNDQIINDSPEETNKYTTLSNQNPEQILKSFK